MQGELLVVYVRKTYVQEQEFTEQPTKLHQD